MKKLSYYFLYFIALVLSSCANQVTPTGGPKDTAPPIPLNYSPDTNTLYFESKQIQIQFDEYIVLNDIFNQVLISPPLENAPSYKIKGKTLIIDLNSQLKDSTTYTINFGQAIKDNTEGNVLYNFTYVFSTGAYLDSLQISGKVTDLQTGLPLENTFVVLYYEPTDTSFTTTKPYYFSKTDKTGSYIIKNIRPGNYKLYAIEDQNFNYYYDLPNERIAFLTSTLYIDSNVTGQNLQMFSEEKTIQNLLEVKSQRYAQTQIVFSKKATDVSITSLNTAEEKIYFTRNKTYDTISIWSNNYKLDTFKIEIKFDTTSITRKIPLKSIPADSNFLLNKNKFTTNVVALSKGGEVRADWDPGKNILLSFYNPIDTINSEMIQNILSTDSITFITPNIFIDSLDARKVYIKHVWIPEKTYDLFIPQNLTRDIFGLGNLKDTLKLQIRKTDAYAELQVAIKNEERQDLIFQLLKTDYTVVEEIKISGTEFSTDEDIYTVILKYLLPATYKLRVIIDSNSDGKWTAGNHNNNTLPEQVLLFPVDQNLRANWENEIDWVIK